MNIKVRSVLYHTANFVLFFKRSTNVTDCWEIWSGFESVVFEHMSQIYFMSTSCEMALWRNLRNTILDKSTLVQLVVASLDE